MTPRETRARAAVEGLLAAAAVLGLVALATARGPPTPGPPTAGELWRSIPVDVARDGRGRLRLLPGLGPIRVQAILDDRAFSGPLARVEDLRRIRGFGAKTVESLRSAGAMVAPEPALLSDRAASAATAAHGPEPPTDVPPPPPLR